jgi:hypothetical protein
MKFRLLIKQFCNVVSDLPHLQCATIFSQMARLLNNNQSPHQISPIHACNCAHEMHEKKKTEKANNLFMRCGGLKLSVMKIEKLKHITNRGLSDLQEVSA